MEAERSPDRTKTLLSVVSESQRRHKTPGIMAVRAIRAPINWAITAVGRTAETARRVAHIERVDIAEGLSGLSALAPGADEGRMILYFHGGGHWLLKADSYREFIGRLSAATGVRVVAVDYRKPPKVRFPQGINDAMTAWKWAQERTPSGSLAVAGDSSGGNLAFALIVRLAQLAAPMPAALIGISPWLRLDLTEYPWDVYGKFCTRLYLGPADERLTTPDDPLCSPVNAAPELVKRFPPILMHAGKWEITTDDVKEMQGVLGKNGRTAEVEFYRGPHVFQVGPGFKQASQDSLRRMALFLERQWAVRQQSDASECTLPSGPGSDETLPSTATPSEDPLRAESVSEAASSPPANIISL